MIAIKIADPSDLPKIAPLFDTYRQFYKQQPNLDLAIQFLRKRMENHESIILLAENSAQQAVGFCQIYPSFCSLIPAPIYILSDLFTIPEARATGVGTALLRGAHEHAKIHGIARLDLTTAKNNHTAQALYESLGWMRDNIFYAYHKIL